jgi:hypothetical protein
MCSFLLSPCAPEYAVLTVLFKNHIDPHYNCYSEYAGSIWSS